MEKTDNQIKMKEFWPRLWQMLEPLHLSIKAVLVWILFVEIAKLGGPYILKIVIDTLTQPEKFDLKYVVFLAVILFAVDQVSSLVDNLKDRKIFNISIELENDLMLRAQKKLMSLGLSYHEKANTGSKIFKIQNGIQRLVNLVENMLWEVVPVLLQLLITIMMLFWFDWRLSLSFVIFAPIFLWLTYRVNVVVYPMRRKKYDKYEEAGGRMAQSVININTVKSFVREKKEISIFGNLLDIIRKSEKMEWHKIANSSLLRMFVVDFGRLVILSLGSYLAWSGQMTVGSLVFVVTLSEKAYSSLFRLTRFYDRLQSGAIAVDRLGELFDEKMDIENKKGGLKPKVIDGAFEFKNVYYRYAPEGEDVLKNINLKIDSGGMTALVGPSGGGKTTLARMLYRHYDPVDPPFRQRGLGDYSVEKETVGKILLDGRDLRDYDLFAMRRFMAIVPQEVEIFDGTIKDNISYAKSGASKEEVEAAARIANVEEFVSRFPEGYDTQVGERGMKLSGGQRQRIGIARAILANPRILIFDEATSNLDSVSERLIQESMDKISRNRTTIVIAHRLSTIKKADKIVVLEKGEVKEAGNHLELSRNKGGLYAKLLELQKVGDIE